MNILKSMNSSENDTLYVFENYLNEDNITNSTSFENDLSEAEARINRFQMIKVIVLVTVMTLILITSCRSMIAVLGRYVNKRH
jgi:hypothetical protein